MRRRELAARLQRAEAEGIALYLVTGMPARDARAATRRVGGVVCLRAPQLPPFLNRALGVGTIAEATPALLERIERHYAAAGLPARLAIATGCVTAATVRLLERRGYAPEEDEGLAIYAYDRRRPPRDERLPDVTVERVDATTAPLFARVAYESFRERGTVYRTVMEAIARRRRGVRCYLARVGTVAAGTGMLVEAPPVAGLATGSVRERFRGRGLQRVLIAHRVRDGWARGYRLFFSETATPASARNLEAVGFRKVYDEVDWVRPTAGRGPGA